MKLASDVVDAKKKFARDCWMQNPKATGMQVNDLIFKNFNTRLNYNALYEIKHQVKSELRASGQDTVAPSVGGPAILPEIGSVRVASMESIAAANQVKKEAKAKSLKVESPVEKETPRSVLVAMATLLDEMRKNRIEEVSVHASGSTKFSALQSQQKQVHFGGRRPGDPAPTVSLQ